MNYYEENPENIKRAVHSWLSPSLELRRSEISGLGIYALKEIPKGELLTVWGGKVYTKQEVIEMPESKAVKHIVNQASNDFLLGPTRDDELDWPDFYNHSCEPNGDVVNSIFLIANKDIKIDEEVTFDYASCNNDFLEMECECGAPTCRKYISNNDRETLKTHNKASNWPNYTLPK